MKLSDKQALFLELLGQLIVWANTRNGVRLRLGWGYDPPGTGSRFRSARSLHRSRLAADLILDLKVNGRWVYQRSTEAYRFLGERWMSMHELCEWGGASRAGTARNDGNHFSLRHGGRW